MQYVDLTDTFLNFELIYTDTTTCSYGGTISAPTACVINGRLSYFYNIGSGTNPEQSGGAKLISIDENGDCCTYITPGLTEPFPNPPIGQRGFSDNISISGNTIRWTFSGGASYQWVIPNEFIANKTIIVKYADVSVPSPCGVGAPFKTIITSNNICHEFIQAFPESDNYWASIYDTKGNLIEGGYIGNSPNDLFDRRNSSLPPNIYGTWLRNGANLFNTDSSVSYALQVLGWTQSVLVTNSVPLMCGVSNLGTYVTSKNTYTFYLKHYGIPESITNNSGIELNSICDMQNTFIQQGQISGKPIFTLYYNKDYYVALSANQGHEFFPSLVKDKIYAYIQNVNGQGLPTTGGKLYIAKNNPLIPYGPLPVLTSGPMGFSLVNMSRPVSPIGAFRT